MGFLSKTGILNQSKGFFGQVVAGGGGGSYPNYTTTINVSSLRQRWTGNYCLGTISTSPRTGTFYDPGYSLSTPGFRQYAGLRNVGATGFEIEYDGSFINPAYVPNLGQSRWSYWQSDSTYDPGYDDPASYYYGSLWQSIIGDAANYADSEYGGLPNPCLVRMFIGWDKYYLLGTRNPELIDGQCRYAKNREVFDKQSDPVAVLCEFSIFEP